MHTLTPAHTHSRTDTSRAAFAMYFKKRAGSDVPPPVSLVHDMPTPRCLPPSPRLCPRSLAGPARPPGSARLPWAGSPCSPSAFPSGFRAPAGLLRLLAHRARGPHSTALFARDAVRRGSLARATPRLLLSTCLVARVREKEGKISLEGAHVCAYTPHLLGRLTLTVRGRPRPV